jgi:hypothetical protein
MARRKTLQTNFSSGEIAPDLGMRSDTDQHQNGAKSLLNRRCLIGGGTKRRPGSWLESELAGPPRIEAFIVDQSTAYVLVFTAERVDAYRVDAADGTLTAAGSVTSALWTGSIYSEMDYEQSGNTAFLTHPDMETQVLTRTGASSWAVADFTFHTSGPRTEQPYHKVAGANVTLACSDVTGSITLTVSEAHFVSGHIGSVFRYLGRETLITAVAADGLTATATVLETLPETYTLTVTSSAGFTVGEETEGATTGAHGLVTAIPDATRITVVLRTQTAFSTENIIGPEAKTAISAVSTTTNAAIKEWDEQLFSAVNGYPACCVLHRNRLIFGGHPAVPDALIGSKLNNLYSFDVDDASDGDGFLETIGDAGASAIVQLHSAEQLIVLTDAGPYYCPESAASPFRPSSIAFFPFGSKWPVTATAKARGFDEGVLFVSGSLVIKARPTGNQAQQWAADEVSLLASHMISNPTRLAVTSNFGGGPERYAAIINDDGTMAMAQLVDAQRIRNFTPWETDGTLTSICAVGSFLYVTTQRLVAGNTKYLLELFDQDITLDAATEYATQAEMNDAASGVPSRYGNTEVHVVVGSQTHLGTYPVSDPPEGPYVVGLYYDSEIELLPPALDDEEGSAAPDLMRILEADANVIASQRFAATNDITTHTLSAYQVTDDVGEPPPDKDGWQKFTFLGWKKSPTVRFTQPDPLPLDVLAVRTTVAF